jgi:AcrR family transcriptional regulator
MIEGAPMNRRSAAAERGPARAASREQIAWAALAISDEHGIDSLNMRRLAAEVGLSPMGLYRYFRNKEELYEGMVAAASEEVAVDLPEGDWRERIRALVRGMRVALERHPSAVELRLRRPMLTEGALRVTETGLSALRNAGFDRATATRAFRTLWLYAFASAAFNAPRAPEETRRLARATLSALPPDRFPEMTAAADEAAATMSGDEQFDFGLDLLVDSLERRLDASGATG